MAQLTELHITRAMSTPLVVSLVADHLPEPVRQALKDLVRTRGELAAAEQALASAKGTAWGPANERLTEARGAADKALEAFGSISAGSSTAISDSAAATFATAMDTVTSHVAAALEALREADQAAMLWHSVKPGKPVLRLETQAARESTVHKQLGVSRSDLRDVQSTLPDSVD